MSSIDQRIVEMQFNNKRFEENAKTTMSTLDKLKEKLNFSSQKQSLEEFQNASDSFKLSHIAAAVEEISNRFTLLGNIGQQTMERIASAAVNAGTALIKSISVDQISAGMSKYEQETNIVQTLYGALKPKGVELRKIYDTLEDLTAYSDETSYSYTQMADAISKFVNAGQDLEKSEKVIEGISNAAALAGIGIHDAEIIYRNFADAIGKGGFQLMDWKSIKIAHMDTEWLKKAFIEEAIAQGKLDKSGRVKVKDEKKNKKGVVTQAAKYVSVWEDFEESLRRGWLDTGVLTATMLKYANRELDGFGKEAFAAAQNAKTFTDVLDAVKDSVSTGWSNSFKIVFGELEEAIAFFTPMANKVIEFTSDIDEARNALLQGWSDLGGRDSMISALSTVWDTFTFLTQEITRSARLVFNPDSNPFFAESWGMDRGEKAPDSILSAESLYNFTKGIEEAIKKFHEWLTEVEDPHSGKKSRIDRITDGITGLFSIVDLVRQAIEAVFHFGEKIFEQLTPVLDPLIDLFQELGLSIFDIDKNARKSKALGNLAERIAKWMEPITSRLPKVINKLTDLTKKVKKFLSTDQRWLRFKKSVENAFNGFVDFVPKAIESVISFGKHIYDVIKNSDEWKMLVQNYNRYIKPVLGFIRAGATKFNEALANFFNMDTSTENSMWEKIKKRFSAFNDLGPWLTQQWEALKKQLPWLQDVEDWWNEDPTVQAIKEWVGKIASAIDTFLGTDTSGETSIAGKIAKRFDAMWAELGPWIEEKWKTLETDYPILKTIKDVLTSIFGGGKEAEEAAKKADESGEKTVGFLEKLWEHVTEFVSKINVGNVLTFAVAIAALVKLYQLVKGVADWVSLGATIKEAIEGIATAINDAHKTAKAQNLKAKAETLAMVAGSCWLFADSINKVSALDWGQIGKGIASMVVMMGAELGFMKLLSMINGDPSSKFGPIMGQLAQSVDNLSTLVSISISLLTFGLYLNMVAGLEWGQIQNGVGAMCEALLLEVGLIGVLKLLQGEGTFGNIMNNLASALSNSVLLLSISLNLLTLGAYLNIVAGLTWGQIQNGLGAMGLALTEELGFIAVLKLLQGEGKFGNVVNNLAGAIGNSLLLSSLSLNLLTLGAYLNMVAGLTWGQIQGGLSAMGLALMAELGFIGVLKLLQGAGDFASIMSNLTGAIDNSILLNTMSINLLTLGAYLNQVASLSWDQITKGLTAMVALFTGEGALAAFLSVIKGGFDTAALSAALGVLAGGTANLANSIEKLGSMSWDQLILGFGGLLGVIFLLKLFIKSVYDLPPVKPTEMIGVAIVAGSIWLVANALAPLCQYNMEGIISGLTGMIGAALVLGVFINAMQNIETVGIKKLLSTIVVSITLAGLMVAFAFALSMIKDVDPVTILAFGGAMLLVGFAMEGLSKAIQTLSTIKIGAAIKAIGIIGGAVLVIGGAIALLTSLAGNVMEGFGQNIAMVGSYLSLYSDSINGINYEDIGKSITAIKDLSEAFVEVGLKEYGNLESFKTNLTRMGGSVRIFSLSTTDLDVDKMKSITGALKQMATDLSGFPEVKDVGTSIGHVGGAIKLYSESLNGVDLSKAPDSTAIKTVFNTLKDAIPSDDNLDQVSAFATEDKGSQMTNFAIGLTNIATAVSDFSKNSKDLDFDSITKATDALAAITSLNTGLSTTVIASFGPFSAELSQQTPSMSTFGEDIITLGVALKDFGENVTKASPSKLNTGAKVLEKIALINEKLPKEGGLSQWLEGSVSLSRFAAQLKLLGEGAKSFNDSISGGEHDFSPAKVEAAGSALIKIAEINEKLPVTGGISSWFTGDQSLSGFGSSLEKLGEGVAKFATAYGTTKISKDILDGIDFINRLANIQVKLGKVENWYSLATFGDELSKLATSAVSANETMAAMVLGWEDPTSIITLVNGMADAQVKLGNIQFRKSLADLGTDMKKFFETIYSFTQDKNWLGNTSDTDRLERVTNAVVGIFGSIHTAIMDVNEDGDMTATGNALLTSLMNGFTDETATETINAKINTLMSSISTTARSYEYLFKATGTWIPKGLGDGIWENRYAAINAAVDVMNAAIEAAEKAGGIASPSKEFARLGMYSDLGLAKGFRDYIPVVTSATEEVSNEAINTVLGIMNDVQNLPLEDMELTPSIRPVLDVTSLRNSSGVIDGLLSGKHSVSFNTSQLEAKAQLLNDTRSSDISSIGRQVSEVNSKLEELSEAITKMKLVLNTGELVGGIESEVDKRLGARGRLAERGA